MKLKLIITDTAGNNVLEKEIKKENINDLAEELYNISEDLIDYGLCDICGYPFYSTSRAIKGIDICRDCYIDRKHLD